MKIFILRHLQVFFDTLGKMAQTPLPTLMTISVIGVAIALPLMLLKISDSLGMVAGKWQGQSQITVFMKLPNQLQLESADESEQLAMDLGQSFLQIPSVKDVEYISPQQALDAFRESSDMGDILDDLTHNPLPPQLLIILEADISNHTIEQLVSQISDKPEVDTISYDQQWLERLSAIIELFKRGTLVLSSLMAIGVVLIISSTVRVGILNRSEEIQIIDQIGGTFSFIRRPFLYYGVLQGVAGALAALIISNLALLVLSKPVERIAVLYDSSFRIQWIDAVLFWAVVAIAAALGWIAARFTVGNYLRKLRASAREK